MKQILSSLKDLERLRDTSHKPHVPDTKAENVDGARPSGPSILVVKEETKQNTKKRATLHLPKKYVENDKLRSLKSQINSKYGHE